MPKTRRYVCVHGHYYQPPRDNPWLEAIDPQPSAAPFRDWNARILDECYRPNAAARIVDGHGYITEIINNYARTSFNIGPTLMSWLASEARDVYDAIVRADRLSQERFGGHGSAMAQAYNHAIMPLCSDRDIRTQVIWGVRDFEHRFGRRPAGMWLPETAVDLRSLDALAAHGIEFTLLAPSQAKRVRKLGAPGDGAWTDVTGGRVDPRRCYRCALPSGRSIDVYFYDGPTSRAVAFEHLLSDGARFAKRLLALHDGGDGLAHIATDGETYGHHHRYGDMALAFACNEIERSGTARLTNYGEFRALRPAEYEVEIIERTAWSCAHGVGRWKDDCGCDSGAHPEWHQKWRAPLRQALEWLRSRLADVYEDRADDVFDDPWDARDAYIDVVLDRSDHNVARFLEVHAGRALGSDEARRALQLLEMQRHAMLMFTSCGWFFDDISGIETVQILRYAARAVELAALFGYDLEAELVERLAQAPSNLPQFGDGRGVWTQLVNPSRASLREVVAHQAVMSLFEDVENIRRMYCYEVTTSEFRRASAGAAKLVTGVTRVTSTITRAEGTFCFAALHLGDHNIMGGVLRDPDRETYEQVLRDVFTPFERADLVATQRELDRRFHDTAFSLRSLFLDQRDHVLSLILEGPRAEAETAFRQLYDRQIPLMRYLGSLALPPPEILRLTAQLVLDLRVRRELESERPDLGELATAIEQARNQRIQLDTRTLTYEWQLALERGAARLAHHEEDLAELRHLGELAHLAAEQRLEVHPWKLQNTCWELTRTLLAAKQRRAQAGNADARTWLEAFVRLCDAIHIRVAAR